MKNYVRHLECTTKALELFICFRISLSMIRQGADEDPETPKEIAKIFQAKALPGLLEVARELEVNGGKILKFVRKPSMRTMFDAQDDVVTLQRMLIDLLPRTQPSRSLVWKANPETRTLTIGDSELGTVAEVKAGTATHSVLQALYMMSGSTNRPVNWHPTIAMATDRLRQPDADVQKDKRIDSPWVLRRQKSTAKLKKYAAMPPGQAKAALSALMRKVFGTANGRKWRKNWIHDRDGRVRFGPPDEPIA